MAGGSPHRHPCKIEGCERAGFKGDLCRKHYVLVPAPARMIVATEAMDAAHAVAKKHHRRQLAYVRKLIREGAAV